jgi:peptide/nickel transport system permease protein
MLGKLKTFHIGLFLLSIILLTSIVFPILISEPSIHHFRYTEETRQLIVPPYAPSQEYWLGTDRNGKDLFYAIVDGAKYTIIFAGIITLARMIISLIMGMVFKRVFINSWWSGLIQSFQYIPQSLIVLLILSPLMFYELRSESVLSYAETLIIQLIVLVTVGILPLGKMIAETAESLSRFQYITCSKHMGASSFQITKRHIMPHMWPRLFILAGRQFTQVLTLMLHLAIYHLFIGGVKITSGQEHDQFNNYSTISNEWTGLISMYHRELMLEPFVIMIPVAAYTLLILCINIMTNSLERSFDKRALY